MPYRGLVRYVHIHHAIRRYARNADKEREKAINERIGTMYMYRDDDHTIGDINAAIARPERAAQLEPNTLNHTNTCK